MAVCGFVSAFSSSEPVTFAGTVKARLCQTFGEFAARGQLVGHGYDVLIKRAFQEFEIILCRGVLGLADIGLTTNEADTS